MIAVVFQLDVHLDAAFGLREQRVERRCELIAKFRRGATAERDSANLVVGQVPDFLRHATEPGEIAVMRDHEHIVLGKLHVRLDVIRARGDRLAHGGERVFRRPRRRRRGAHEW